MILIIWIEYDKQTRESDLPKLRLADLLLLDEDLEERKSLHLVGCVPGDAGCEDVLQDWKTMFDAVFDCFGDGEERILVFPNSRQRDRFFWMRKKVGDARNATHYGTLGELLVTNGAQQSEGAETGIPRLAELIRRQGVRALIREGTIQEVGQKRSVKDIVFGDLRFQYYGDRVTKQYHLRTCERLGLVTDANLVGLVKNPDKKGWAPCPLCVVDLSVKTEPAKHRASKSPAVSRPKPIPKMGWEKRIENKGDGSQKTKAQIIKREITAICEEHGMFAEFAGGTVFVTTVAGEWFFDYNDRPIRLRHKNYTEKTKRAGKSMEHYHLQGRTFASPLHVIQYISAHDLELNRRVMQDVESEMAADEYFFRNMGVVGRAAVFASKAHEGQTRKGSSLPYILHPMETAVITASITDDEEVIAAALLHDVLEDTGTQVADLQKEFGVRICKLVQGVSENKRPGAPAAETWKIRKSETIEYLHSLASGDERIIALADKLSNMRASWRDFQVHGDAMWEKFNMPDKVMQAWYYRSVRDALGYLQDAGAWKEFSALVDRLFDKIGHRDLDGVTNQVDNQDTVQDDRQDISG